MQLVAYDAPKNPARYYGAPCMPTVKGLLWECVDRAEYNALREAYEGNEGNCNTCVHLIRPPSGQPKDPSGFLRGACDKRAIALHFHPGDPTQLDCHKQRTRSSV